MSEQGERRSGEVGPHERVGIAIVVAAALALRMAFAWTLPVFQAPDEQAHFHYVVFLGEEGALPIHPGERSLDLFADPMAEAYQPPLAYASFVPLDRALTAAGAWRITRLRAVRMQNALYGAATVLIGSLVAIRLTRRGDPRRLLTALALAFLPGFAAIGAAANNDGLANLLAAALWLTLIPPPGGRRSAWRNGLLFGAACLAKLSNLALAPLLFAVPLLVDRRDWRGALRFAAIAGATAAVVMLPWIWHNVVQYGNPLAIGVGSIPYDWLESELPPEQLAVLSRVHYDNTFFQFWGRFGIANNLSWIGIPVVGVPLASLAAIGWLRPRPHAPGPDAFDAWAPAWLLALALALVGLVQFSLQYAGAWQGRYLYTVLVPLALLFAGGLVRWLPSRAGARLAQRATAALAVVLVVVNVIVIAKLLAFFAEVPPTGWLRFTRL